jgi:hypothetical protein
VWVFKLGQLWRGGVFMLTVKIEGLEELKRRLNDMGRKQVPFAAAKAITKTAKSVEKGLQGDMASAFKSASPYTQRATFSTSATKSNLTATVGLKDQKPSGGTAPSVLLKEHFTGGLRGNKPYEKAIISMAGMPAGYRAIPAGGIKKDAYGNPNRKEIGEMLGALRSRIQVFKGRGKKLALVGYFIVPVGAHSHLVPGIYKRIARGALAAMFIFVKSASYRKVLDLPRTADQIVRAEFQPNFDAAFTEAMRTAR